MESSQQNFELGVNLEITLDSKDNDGLIFIPKNTSLEVKIENYHGKILINELVIKKIEDELSLSKDTMEISSLDLKLLDRFLFKQLNDKATYDYSPYKHFLNYDFSVFEKGRRPSEIDWAMFSSLYVFSCNVLPESIKVELSLAKELRISEENVKKYLKKVPENIFIKTGGMEKRGGNLTFDAEELIKNYLGEYEKKVFEENPFLKFHSDLDLA